MAASARWTKSVSDRDHRRGGVAAMVRDVANVRIGGDLRTGAASENGNEVVVGTALDAIAGGNSGSSPML